MKGFSSLNHMVGYRLMYTLDGHKIVISTLPSMAETCSRL